MSSKALKINKKVKPGVEFHVVVKEGEMLQVGCSVEHYLLVVVRQGAHDLLQSW